MMQVCDYHAEFYRPENLCVIITGQVKPEEVFEALQPIEEKIMSKVTIILYIIITTMLIG